MGFGYVEDNVFKTDTSSFMNCGPQGGDIILTYTMTNGKGLVQFWHQRLSILMKLYLVEVVMVDGVPVPVTASCQGKGVGTLVMGESPDGGGVSFANETSQSKLLAILYQTRYIPIQYTLTNSCFDQVKTLTFTFLRNLPKASLKGFVLIWKKRYKNVKYTGWGRLCGRRYTFLCDAPIPSYLNGSLP